MLLKKFVFIFHIILIKIFYSVDNNRHLQSEKTSGPHRRKDHRQTLYSLPLDEVAGASFTENLAPGNDLEWVQKNLARKIEVEKIQAVFDVNGLGDARSKADKQLKAVIIKKVFGTTSTTEIEKMDAAQLNYCRAVLEDLFKTLSAANPEDPLAYLNQLDQAA